MQEAADGAEAGLMSRRRELERILPAALELVDRYRKAIVVARLSRDVLRDISIPARPH